MQETVLMTVDPPITFVERDWVYPKAKESPSTAVHPQLGDMFLYEFQEGRNTCPCVKWRSTNFIVGITP